MPLINCVTPLVLRGYAQNNPVVEYQSESFKMFQDMIGAIEYDVTRTMMKAQTHEQARDHKSMNAVSVQQRPAIFAAHQADANGQRDSDLSQGWTE